jgi:internalin A
MSIDTAKARIEYCVATQATLLNLNGLELTYLPKEIKNLKNLTWLECRNNNLQSLNGIEALKKLRHLVCCNNQLKNLNEVKNLTQLRHIVCSVNNLKKLPNLQKLTHLTNFICNYNQLKNISGLEGAERLTWFGCKENELECIRGVHSFKLLESLDCTGNQLQSIYQLSRIKNLEFLYCDQNQLEDLEGLEKHTKLKHLICSNNKIKNLDNLKKLKPLIKLNASGNFIRHIPNVFISNINKLKDYWQDIETSGYLINTRTKLLLLGNGRVGKTTFAKALVDGKPQSNDDNSESTVGISLVDWSTNDSDGNPIQVRIWDFGGQELYHATHRLFLTQSGTYCVLWAEKTDEENDVHNHPLRYWLDLISQNKTKVPVIIVKNQIDRSNELGLHNESLQDRSFNQLPHFGISAKKYKYVDSVVSILHEHLKAYQELQIRIPSTWGAVRDALEAQGKTISKKEFEGLCKDKVIHPETLLEYLHNCGELFYRKNRFGGTIFLDQNWALKAIYRIFEISSQFGNPRQFIENNNGKISGEEFCQIFKEYKSADVQLFVSFMVQSQMLFSLNRSKDTFDKLIFVVPGLLPSSRPITVLSPSNAKLQYKLEYPWMHRLAIERIIVECHHLSSENLWWRNGITLSLEENVVCTINADVTHQSLVLAFWGELEHIKQSLPKVIKTIERTKMASPNNESMYIKGKGWIDVSQVLRSAKVSDNIVDNIGNTHNGLEYYNMLDIDCEEITISSKVASSIHYHFNKKALILDRSINNSPGAINTRDVTNSKLTTNVNISKSEEQKESLMSQIEELKAVLHEISFESKQKYIGQLETVQEEINTANPDEGFIEKTLSRFASILDCLENGKKAYSKASIFLANCGVII